jgi:hypothetical protein
MVRRTRPGISRFSDPGIGSETENAGVEPAFLRCVPSMIDSLEVKVLYPA